MQHCRQIKLTAAILIFFISPLLTAGASCNTVTLEQSCGTYTHQHKQNLENTTSQFFPLNRLPWRYHFKRDSLPTCEISIWNHALTFQGWV